MSLLFTTLAGNYVFFSIRVFFHRQWRFTGQQGKGRDHLLFHSTISTRSRILRHLLATSHVIWLSRIFNRNACVYQPATLWDLPTYRLPLDWLADDVMFVCLLDELVLGFCYSDLIWETVGCELVSTTTFVLQANRLTYCPSHHNCSELTVETLEQGVKYVLS